MSARPASGAPLRAGWALHAAGDLAGAERAYREVLAGAPDDADALHLLGLVAHARGELAAAEAQLDAALARRPGDVAMLCNLGAVLRDRGRPADALSRLDEAVRLGPAHALAWDNRGTVLLDLGRVDEAVLAHERAVQLGPRAPAARFNLGNAHRAAGRAEPAMRCYQEVLALDPHHAGALNNLGNGLLQGGRAEEAATLFARLVEAHPGHLAGWVNLAAALLATHRAGDALRCCDRALAIDAGCALAHVHRGGALLELGQASAALSSLDRALAIAPQEPTALRSRANAAYALGRFDEAAAGYAEVLHLAPRPICFSATCSTHGPRPATGAVGPSCSLRCEPASPKGGPSWRLSSPAGWRSHPKSSSPARAPTPPGLCRGPAGAAVAPESGRRAAAHRLLFIQLSRARDGVSHRRAVRTARPAGRRGPRLRAGADQRRCHATARRRRRRSLGRARRAERRRGRRRGAGRRTRHRGRSQRPHPRRPPRHLRAPAAPLQVVYLGDPGTTGSPCMDYLIADRTVIPDEPARHCSEHVVFMPHSYQVNDDRCEVAVSVPTRSGLGLPAGAFVYCCLNHARKITPEVFAVWMGMLRQVEGSVLWLFAQGVAAQRLRAAAEAEGVAASRLVFAPPLPVAEHRARYRLADLFLDTFDYNGHATSSDALWAGLPVLTRAGRTFAARVSASLLGALGLPELVTDSTPAYLAAGVMLARRPDVLAALRQRLATQRQASPLFDTRLFARHLEAAYAAMAERARAGLAPEHIHVAA